MTHFLGILSIIFKLLTYQKVQDMDSWSATLYIKYTYNLY